MLVRSLTESDVATCEECGSHQVQESTIDDVDVLECQLCGHRWGEMGAAIG